MKKLASLLGILLCLLISQNISAQIPNGSLAPDFTITDIDGNEHDLYDYLDQGYNVVLEFTCTWTAPAWNYHLTDALNNLHNEHGPTGSDDFIVLMVEGDDDTTIEDLQGIGGDTMGDWITATDFPIIDDAQSIFELYECTYYPTIYSICPDGIITEIGQSEMQAFLDYNEIECCPGDFVNDLAIVPNANLTHDCDDPILSFSLKNFGTETLTAADIDISINGDYDQTVNWSGALGECESESIEIQMPAMAAEDQVYIQIISADDDASNNATTVVYIGGAAAGGTHLRIELLTDEYPAETIITIEDEEGNMVATESPMDGQTLYVWDYYLSDLGCYTFRITDSFGDGMNGSQWGNADGTCYVYFVNDDGTAGEYILSYDGNSDYTELNRSLSCQYESEVIVSGIVYNDQNENGVKDTFEVGIPNVEVTLDDITTISGADGTYFFNDVVDPQVISIAYDNQVWLTNTTPDLVNLNGVNQYSVHFGLSTSDPYYDGQINYWQSGWFLCEQEQMLYLSVTNNGNSNINAIVTYTVDPLFTILEASPEPLDITDNVISWSVSDLSAGASSYMNVLTMAPDWTAMGETITFEVTMDSFDDESNVVDNDSVIEEAILVCSYDPNDKQVFPEGEGDNHDVMVGTTLEYLVRFQNTGNWFATDITVTDPLSEELDWSSFEMINSSHYCIPTIDMETGEVDFYFPEIMLPDSTTNEPESHGFLAFRINHVEDIALPTLIENTAYIYFDSNPAVVTNTAWTTIDDLTIQIGENDAMSMKLVPNPAKNSFIISSDFAQARITISTIGGSVVWTGFQPLNEPINISDLAPGAYIVQVNDGLNALQELLIKE